MKTIKFLINSSKDTQELKGLVQVYEEIAAQKMQKVRTQILSVQEFYAQLSKLTEEVGADFENIPSFHGKKTAAVFIGSNSGLYGDIVENIFKLFLDFIRTNYVDSFVVGKRGQELMQETRQQIHYQMLELSDDIVEENALREISKKLLGYKKIVFFFGQFKNIAVQFPTSRALPGELLSGIMNISVSELKKIHFHYLYEPTLIDVSDFFADEIFDSIVEQTIHESQLAKFGSRIMHLDQAVDRIDDTIDFLNGQKHRIQKTIANKKQNNMITGIMVRGIK